jgi:NAD(P)-dependent dehydrogenase (short-subunit alcohol dehydrogenase family)
MPSVAFDLPKRVLVCGAAGGIGGAIARRLVQSGSHVIGNDLRAAPATWQGLWITADAADETSYQKIADQIEGPVDGVVMAAGVLDQEDWMTITPQEALTLLTVNLVAPFFLLRNMLPKLREGASVVIIGSVAGSRASPATPFYGASKAALRNLSASLALNFQANGVRVNVVAPGLIDTTLTEALNGVLAERQGRSIEEVRAHRSAAIPMQRPGTVEEVADACLYLLGSGATYLTGATIFATGGVLAGAT